MIETARAALVLLYHHRNLVREIRYTDTATMVHIIVIDTNGAGIAEGLLDQSEFIKLQNEAMINFVKIVP